MVPPRAPPRLEAARSHPPASLPTLPCCALAHAKRPNRLLRWFPSSSGLTLCFSMFKPLGYWRQQPQKPTYNRVWFAFQTRLETFGSFGFCLEKKNAAPSSSPSTENPMICNSSWFVDPSGGVGPSGIPKQDQFFQVYGHRMGPQSSSRSVAKVAEFYGLC